MKATTGFMQVEQTDLAHDHHSWSSWENKKNSAHEPNGFDHKKASVGDKILLIGELEHIRRHALRSAVATYDPDNIDNLEWSKYMLIAKEAQALRREYQKEHFDQIADEDWCLCKASASLRQLAYEVCTPENIDMLRKLDDLVDEIWGAALDMDLSDCVSCREDREATSSDEPGSPESPAPASQPEP